MAQVKPFLGFFWKSYLAQFDSEKDLRWELMRAEALEGVLAIQMLELKHQFDRAYPQSQPARLHLHRTGRSLALRWRLAFAKGQAHDFFALRHDKSPGREVLDGLPKTRRARYLKYENDALTLNAAYAVSRYQRDRLIDHLRKRDRLVDTIVHYKAEQPPEDV